MNPQDTSALGQEGKLEWEISDFAQCVYIDATLRIQDGDSLYWGISDDWKQSEFSMETGAS